MSRTRWKHREREAARLIGGRRYPANVGGRVDVESEGYVGTVKDVGRLSLAALEALTVEIEQIGRSRVPPKLGVLMVRRSVQGIKTPWLCIVTEAGWRNIAGGPGLTTGEGTSC